MKSSQKRLRQVVDWTAVFWAGIISGLVFLSVAMILSVVYVGSPWIVPRLVASIVLGSRVLPPPATFDVTIFFVALFFHLCLSLAFSSVIAFVLHRWGIVVGILGGALFGLALYSINFYSISYFYPWLFPMRSWLLIVSHIAFGALAGGTYEALEVEKFVPVEERDPKA